MLTRPPSQEVKVALDETPGRRRILHCAYSGLGGHAAVLFALLSEASSRQSDHFVVFFGVEDLRANYAAQCRALDIPFIFIRKEGWLAPRSHAQLIKAIAGFGPDVVMINGSSLTVPLLLWRALTGASWGVLVRETQPNHLKTKPEWVGSYLAAALADGVAYLTAEYRAQIDAGLKLPLKRRGTAHIIANGVAVGAAPDFESRETRSTLTLTMVSRIVPIKDHRTLLESMRLLVYERGYTGLTLKIAGDGPMLSSLAIQSDATHLSDVVTLMGSIDSEEVAMLLKASDIYVHCTYGETMSNSILQAMAAGLPVVASAVVGVSNMIRHGVDGMLVPAQNPVALADALEELINSPARRRELGEAAWIRAKSEYSREMMATRYCDLFEAIAARRSKASRGRLFARQA
jgi:L-malate glycosyltransferase